MHKFNNCKPVGLKAKLRAWGRRTFPKTAFFLFGAFCRTKGAFLFTHPGFPRACWCWLWCGGPVSPWRAHRDGRPLYMRETIGKSVCNDMGIAKITFTK